MQQVLFTIFGLPLYGFGAMLFVTFVAVVWWGTRRSKRIGLPAERFQDFAIYVFICGIIGARILYMIQYANQFPDHSLWGLAIEFIRIDKGGIVFYGSALGGTIGYFLFYWFVMRRMNVSGWQLADAVAPLLAMGLAIGRIGCYLNGCCWGTAAHEETCPVPLGSAHFPLLPAHARTQLVTEQRLQSPVGFVTRERSIGAIPDPRSEIFAVEVGSNADKAGLKAGDRVVRVNGEANMIVIELYSDPEKAQANADILKEAGGKIVPGLSGRQRVEFDSLEAYAKAREKLPIGNFAVTDKLEDLTRDWPRGRTQLSLGVERAGEPVEIPTFTPRTVGLYPTQLYETLSMVLLILFLLAYYPYRRHDGQLMVLVMVGYAIHRFINESLRIEPSYQGGLTLSQWGSVVVFIAAAGIEGYLWLVMPSRWKGEPQYVAPPLPEKEPGQDSGQQVLVVDIW